MPRNAIIDALGVPVRIVAPGLLLAVASPARAEPARASAPELLETEVHLPDRGAITGLRDHGVTLGHGVRVDGSGAVVAPIIGDALALARLRASGFRMSDPRPHGGPPPEGYRAPAEGDAVLRDLAARALRGGLATLGSSVEGRPILGLWLGQPPSSGAPVYRVLGAHHGDEWSSFEVALALAEDLVDADGQDEDVTAWLDESTLWIVPYVNPDGVERGRRYNARSVDLNRNYGFEWGDGFDAGPEPFSEPEVRAVRDAFFYDPPLIGLSLHAGAANIGYVWNWTTEQAPDRPLLESLAWRYAEVTTAPDFWVTNGAEWYVTRGDTNDWSYGEFGAFDFTVELTVDKSPPPEEIAVFVADHLAAVRTILRTTPDRSGRVSDAATGQPLPARVRWVDADDQPRSAWLAADPETGRFHVLAPADPGLSLEIQAPGWHPLTLPAGSDLDVRLDRATVAEGRPFPAVARSGDTIELPADVTGPVQLSRAGSGDLLGLATGGRLTLGALHPGAWTIVLPDGATYPSALLVPSGGASADEALVSDGALTLTGSGFGEGTRAWALWGPVRAHVPLPVLAEGPDELVLDLSPVPDGAMVDVLVLTNGSHVAVADVFGVDDAAGERSWLAGGGGCATVPLSPAWLALLALASTRRRSC